MDWWVAFWFVEVGLEDWMGEVRDFLVWVVCLAVLGMMGGGGDLGEWWFMRVLD